MRVLITGGLGFVGKMLCSEIMNAGKLTGPNGDQQTVTEIVLFDTADTVAAGVPDQLAADSRVRVVGGDISDRDTVNGLVEGCEGQISVFHLASVMSGQGEDDFDLCLAVNLEGSMMLLEALRALEGCPRIVVAGSCAAVGACSAVDDKSKFMPQSTYGMTKALLEMLVNDYTRRGFIDGRTVRLPTIIVRPGLANTAATGAFSEVIRGPLAEQEVTIQVDPYLGHACCSYYTAVAFMIALHELPTNALPMHDRTMQISGMRVTVHDLMVILNNLAEIEGLKLPEINMEFDPEISSRCGTLPTEAESDRTREFGMPMDTSLEQIVWTYYYDFVKCSGEVYSRPPVGFVGLGNMGAPMASNLGRNGFPVVLYNRTKSKAKALARFDDRVAATYREVAEGAKIICTCLPTEAEVDSAILGTGGLVEYLTPGSILIDHSTVSPATTMRCHAASCC